MNRRELKEKLLTIGIPEEVIAVLPKILVASNKTFIEPDGSRSNTFRGNNGIIVGNMDIINQSGIVLTGVNASGNIDALAQIKRPSHFELGKLYPDPVKVRIALYTEDNSVIVTSGYPRAFTLFSPVVSVYSPETVQSYLSKNFDSMTDVFDLIFNKKIKPDSVTKLKCQRISYRTPFEATKLSSLIEKTKKKQIH